ncbi:MAG: glutamate-5-semialdehyde dehydrogenase [Lachnospiraceae bacterium]|nr:glutamate-5-semialdehyde dehydrogenase [Lachnospiraceae bacterium]
MAIRDDVKEMKLVSPYVASTTIEVRNRALEAVAKALGNHADEIFAQNKIDLAKAEEDGVPAPVVKRLKFDDNKLRDVQSGIRQLQELPDPLGRVTLHRMMDEGLELTRVTTPIGVIGVIFEARPDAMVQIASLCIKSGNCAILKGGKETANTNRYLFSVIEKAVVDCGYPKGALLLAETHSEIDELLQCDREVDLLIPRGSNQFVRYIMDHTKIPVMGHADGICHIYVDEAADQEAAIRIILDAKMQYTAACNAVETLLVHKKIAEEFLPRLCKALAENGIRMNAAGQAAQIMEKCRAQMEGASVEKVEVEDFKEYLDLVVSVGVVDDVDAAIAHINRYGSHHTDAILTGDDAAAERFMQLVDSAGVYRNCSTRFSDGFRYGFGAEVGISTGKLHARGPVGLEGLVTYKYKLTGNGQIVGDYASGRAQFHFRDI